MPSALITGASSGIGKEFANQLAGRGFDLILVARDEERLNTVGEELSTRYSVGRTVIKADLSRLEEINELALRIKKQELSVDLLVNNAGFGLNVFNCL